MSLETPIKIRMLQRKLYQKAKGEPSYRFYLLYDKMYREDILAHAYALVKSNQGAPGVDGQTFWGIETLGLGLYGMLSSSVAQRTGEIGVRMALGAKRGVVLRMILSEALVLLAAGLVPGAIGLVIAARFIEKMLYGVSAFDPIRLAGITAVLAFVAIVASLLPALRA